jgi:rhodanese-related sulfurtransferase
MSRGPKGVDVARAAELMKAGAMMVDVRERHEFAKVRIPGSVNAALSELEAIALPETDGRPIVFYCASGGRTAMNAGRLAAKAGAAEAYVMSAGIVGWSRAGMPVQQGGGAGDGDHSHRSQGFFSRLFG